MASWISFGVFFSKSSLSPRDFSSFPDALSPPGLLSKSAREKFALLGRPCFFLLVFEHAGCFDLCALLVCELREAIGLLSCISDRNNGVGKTFDIFIEFPNFLQGVVDLCHLLDVGVFRLIEPFRDGVFRDVVDDLVQRLPGGVVGRNNLLDVLLDGRLEMVRRVDTFFESCIGAKIVLLAPLLTLEVGEYFLAYSRAHNTCSA